VVKAKPLTQEDVFLATYVLGGALSADGELAVYVLSETVGKGDDEKQCTSLWRADTNGGTPQRLTAARGNDQQPQLSSDGNFVYFLSDRNDVNQIYRLPLSGGEAEQLTDLPQGVTLYDLSPDGKTLAFAALAELPSPQGPHDHVRVTRAWWRMDVLGYLDKIAQQLHTVSAKGSKHKALTEPEGMVTGLHWSPDGSEVGYATSAGEDQGFIEGAIKAVGKRGTRVLFEGMVQDFFWTGDRIGFADGSQMSRHAQLKTVSLKGGRLRSHTKQSDLAVGAFFQVNSPAARNPSKMIPTSDGKSVYCGIAVGGEAQIHNISIQGRERNTAVVSGPRICTLVDANDDALLLTIQDHNNPPELFIHNLASGEERQLTDHNGTWKQRIRWPDIERITVRSAPGVTIEGWVLKPKHMRAPYKTILYIHGGPHAGFGLSFQADFQELVGAGYAVVFCNPRGSTGYSSDFASSILECWGKPETQDFSAILNKLIRDGIAHKDKLGVTGVSGGGHLSGWLIGHTHRFKAAVPEQGVYNMFSMWGVSDAGTMLINLEMGGDPYEQPERYWELSPVAHAHKCRTPTLLIQGENDIRCPMEQAEQMYQTIRATDCPVELLRLNSCSHGLELVGPPPLRRYRMDAMIEWFDRYVK